MSVAVAAMRAASGVKSAVTSNADARRATIRGEQHDGSSEHVRQQIRQLVHRAPVLLLAAWEVERHVVMRAEPDQSHGATVLLLPRVELIAQEAKAFPKRPGAARTASARDLDHRRRNLHHASIEVERATRGQMIRAASAVQQRTAHDVSRRTENVFRPLRQAVDDRRELRLQSNRWQAAARNGTADSARSSVRPTRSFSRLPHRHASTPFTTDLPPASNCMSRRPLREVRSGRNQGPSGDGHQSWRARGQAVESISSELLL